MTTGRTQAVCAVCEVHAESVFKIEGMDCREEVDILERRLAKLPGLESLSPDLIGQRLRVSYDAAKVSTGVKVSWTASTDNVGVVGYRVYRDGTYVKSVTTTSATVAVGAGTYSYTAAAYDAAGNLSGKARSITFST